MTKFYVGEICEVYAANVDHKWHECRILCLPGKTEYYVKGELHKKDVDRYAVEIPDMPGDDNSFTWQSLEACLRKKKLPPRECDSIVSWDACLWQPEKLKNA